MRQKEKFKPWEFLREEVVGEVTNFGKWKGRKVITRESRPYYGDFRLGRRVIDPEQNTFFGVGGVLAEQSAVITRLRGTLEYRKEGVRVDYLPLVGDDNILSYWRRTGGVGGQVVTRGKRRPVGIDKGETSSDGIPFGGSVTELAELMCRAPVDAETGVAGLVLRTGDEAVQLIWRGNVEKTAGAELAVLREGEDRIDVIIFGVVKDIAEGSLRCWEGSSKSIGKNLGTVSGLSEQRRGELVDLVSELPEAVRNHMENKVVTLGDFGESLDMEGGEKLGDLVAGLSMLEPDDEGRRNIKIGTDGGRIIGVTLRDEEDGTRQVIFYNRAGEGDELEQRVTIALGTNDNVLGTSSETRGGDGESRFLEMQEVETIINQVPVMLDVIRCFLNGGAIVINSK